MTLEAVCRAVGITPQAHYQKKRREERRQEEDAKVLFLVRLIRAKHPRMGVRKLLAKLRPILEREGIQVGRDRLYALLREVDLLAQSPRSRVRTTQAGEERYPNLLKGFWVTSPDRVWVADITFLRVGGDFRYLFLVMDLYSRKIVGWRVGLSLEGRYALEALQMAVEGALWRREGMVHHSDHGVQYTSRQYREYLEGQGIRASMGRKGYAYDNAYMERAIGTLKGEYGLGDGFPDAGSLHRAVEEAVGLYNVDRPHEALGYATPEEVYRGEVVIPPFEAIRASGRSQ